ncbi:hypothetical protein PGT21_001062 [Puccinia graminis f. sp. tritici]|uniref:Uncharacterized protein n=1 Tax=Puccinia graminis f. sp. tritici TaxID=56615 RepID=A0A5B0PWG3_PUCGR|nr:hypothetical protein PGT21_001062 [Puccinia graminis f. sp. tritici]KAA1105089.1 hypothetical protein PGTUg99_005390 [Puccinia graminis f. sp. tritici]
MSAGIGIIPSVESSTVIGQDRLTVGRSASRRLIGAVSQTKLSHFRRDPKNELPNRSINRPCIDCSDPASRVFKRVQAYRNGIAT